MEVVALPAGEEDAESTSIYVKNLAFATTDATLQVLYSPSTCNAPCPCSALFHQMFRDVTLHVSNPAVVWSGQRG